MSLSLLPPKREGMENSLAALQCSVCPVLPCYIDVNPVSLAIVA